jgi:hypothetical protein
MKTLALIGLLGAAATFAAGAQAFGQNGAPAASAHATPAAATERVTPACFRSHDILSHTLADDKTIYINVNNRDYYRVTTEGNCFAGATSSDPLLMRSPPGTSYVCKPIDMDLGVIKGGFAQHCIVGSITPMSRAEVAALPRRLKP